MAVKDFKPITDNSNPSLLLRKLAEDEDISNTNDFVVDSNLSHKDDDNIKDGDKGINSDRKVSTMPFEPNSDSRTGKLH